MQKFKSDMDHRLQIAKENGKGCVLYSSSTILDEVKKWLIEKRISYYELN